MSAAVTPKRFCLVAGMPLLAVVLLIYGKTLTYDFVTWDDPSLITDNEIVTELTLSNVRHAFTSYDPELYIPLTLLSYQIEYALTDGDAGLFHLTNVLLHWLNALLAGTCTLVLLKNKRMAIIVSLLFAVHPLHSEVVSWASGRKDVLSTAFFFAAYLAYLEDSSRPRRVTALLGLSLFTLGLMAKAMVLTLPVILVMTDVLKSGRMNSVRWKAIAPYAALSVVFGIVALIGKQEKLSTLSFVDELLLAAKSIMFALQRIIVPHSMSALHPYYGDISAVNPAFIVPLLLAIGIVSSAFIMRKRHPWIAYGIGFFAVTLSPTFFNQLKGADTIIGYDRYAYLPSFGIMLIVALALDRPKYKRVTGALTTVLCILFAFMAHIQSRTWASTHALFANVSNHYPDSHVAHEHLGNIAMKERRYEDAAASYAITIEHREDPEAGYVNLGAAFAGTGNTELEQRAYETALRIDPHMVHARYNLARSYEDADMDGKAFEHYRMILRQHGDFLDTRSRASALDGEDQR